MKFKQLRKEMADKSTTVEILYEVQTQFIKFLQLIYNSRNFI